MIMYHLELHDSRIERVISLGQKLIIHFSLVWLYPITSYEEIDNPSQDADLDRVLRGKATLSFRDAVVDGEWPDFEDDSYLWGGSLTIAGEQRHLVVPCLIREKVCLEMIFVLGERVRVSGNGLEADVTPSP